LVHAIAGEQHKKIMLSSMCRIRMIEERIADLYPEQEMRCPVHLSIGQEAISVGVCSSLTDEDWVFAGHRGHAPYLAKGGCLKRMLAELYGKSTGCCHGKGGSMHLTDQDVGFIGTTPIVGAAASIAVGASLTTKHNNHRRIVVVFVGDGAMETGVLHESMNFASLKKLPILFVCEDNMYSVYSPPSVRRSAEVSLAELASAHGLTARKGNGNDAWEVFKLAADARKHIAKGLGPVFLDLATYRWREHCGPNYDNDLGYRSEREFSIWKDQDPLELASSWMTSAECKTAKVQITREIDEAVQFARSSPFPDPKIASSNVFAT